MRRVSATESPPNFSSTASASTSATIASATIPAAGTAQTSERWWWATAASPVATSTVRSARGHGGDRLHRGAHPQHLAGGHAALGAAGAAADAGGCPSAVGTISSCASEPGVAASSKPSPTSTPLIAWMPISAPASRESRRRSQWTCEPRPGGRPWTTTSTTPPRVSPSLWAWSIALDHRCAGLGVEAAHRVVVEARHVVGLGPEPGRRRARRRARSTWETIRAPTACSRKLLAHPAERHPGRGLAGRGALEDRAGLVEVVLLHAGQVGVAGPRPGQRGVAGQRLELAGSTGSADITFSHLGHSVLPISIATGPPRVSPCRTPPTMRDLVLLELHPGAAAVAEPAPGQRVGDVVGRHLDVGRQPLEDRDQGGPWDSPAVSQRSMASVFHAGSRPASAVSRRRDSAQIAGPTASPTSAPTSMNGPNGNAVRSTPGRGAPARATSPGTAEEQEAAVDADEQLGPAEVAEREARAARTAGRRRSPCRPGG